jgi:hypothetical protein
MKPDWDKLMDAFADSPSALIGDVDCTAEGKSLCDANGVRGYPSLKWGDPNNLEDYKGRRDYNSLLKFAEENLKPVCSPNNIELCDDETKAKIEKFSSMSDDDLATSIFEKEKMMKDAEEAFKTGVAALTTKKDETLEEIKNFGLGLMNSGLGLMKAVKASKATTKGSDEL